jgi:hypothetical protein
LRCRWVDAELDGPPLMPVGVEQREEADRLISRVDAFVSAGLDLMAGRTGRCGHGWCSCVGVAGVLLVSLSGKTLFKLSSSVQGCTKVEGAKL